MSERSSSDEETLAPSDEALLSAHSLITEAYEILRKEATRVRQEKEAFETLVKKLKHVHFTKPIELNVGGQHFVTSLETLTKDAGSMLNAMFSGRFDTKPSKDGSYFIDRDGTHFLYILNYLRTGKLSAPDDVRTRNELLTEAEFYQIQGIIEELKPKPSKLFSESSILSEEQRRVLESWMEKGSKFILLFRASRDGWKASDFHSRCDYKGATVTIVKSGNNIFGGYTHVPWNGLSGYTECTKSFLFSLVNPAGIGPTKMALKAANRENGICCNSSYGPTFGGGHDLHISDGANVNNNSYSNLNYSYDCPPNQNDNFLTRNRNFLVSEYEVFGYQEG